MTKQKVIIVSLMVLLVTGVIFAGLYVMKSYKAGKSKKNNIDKVSTPLQTTSSSTNKSTGSPFANQQSGQNAIDSTADSSVFKVLPEEEKLFYDRIAKYYNDVQLQKIHSDLDKIKIKYPEGYLIIIKMGAREPQAFQAYYNEKDDASYATCIHEMTHGANNQCLYYDNKLGQCDKHRYYIFLVNGILVKIPYNTQLEQTVLSKVDIILSTVKNQDGFDKNYISKETGGPSYNQLDELDAYLKSVRFDRANPFNDMEPYLLVQDYANLKRLLYHINLMLIEMKKNPSDWALITGDKAFVTMILKLRELALQERVDTTTCSDGVCQSELKRLKETEQALLETDYILKELDSSYVNKSFFDLADIDIKAKYLNDLGIAGEPAVYPEGESPYGSEIVDENGNVVSGDNQPISGNQAVNNNDTKNQGEGSNQSVDGSSNGQSDDAFQRCAEKCPSTPSCDQCVEQHNGNLDACPNECSSLLKCINAC